MELEVREDKQVAWYINYLPGVINAVLIGIFGRLYRTLSFKLIKSENHRYQQSLENSMINKTYIF